ncbi:putative beta-D-xylosidase 7 [Nicotiana tabacum]|uniref:Beta-D-xylosidase 7 n=2 Tax=Nicotiana TaxID=4085 RepID=A0A1S3XXN6_TOBAC|nr:PREDICTED: probable beta-D-xylosidase 7 isoform X1 [Nicotiana sylvestris]XP_016444635.1 PREDICTED: probable beta-D-xylosidase 7 [Nicotiana tabacum]
MGLDKIAVITMIISFLSCTESTRPPFSCDASNPVTRTFTFCNISLPIHQRVEDLISRLNLDEKISQLGNTAPAIPRLNISAYEWWSESLHGLTYAGEGMSFNESITTATQFPQIILTASTFDEHLWYRIAQAISREARAVYNAGELKGMTFFAPNINILRDPRWGRAQETAGEDPMMVGKYGVAYVRGLQGDSFRGGKLKDGHLQASACCKHFTAQDLDHWNGHYRFTFDAQVTAQDMADSFQPPFKSCVEEGKATSLMCAYSRLNGVSNCANYDLLTKTVRGQWGFNGSIVSDCDAVKVMHDHQGYTVEDAVAASLKAGMDVNCGSCVRTNARLALEKKKLQESDIDRALLNIFSIRMRLGLFNGEPRKLEYGNIATAEVCSKKHQDLSLEAARNGIVLLKNSPKLLPLSKIKTTSLAVIGPKANDAELLLGNYAGIPCKNVSLLQGFQHIVKSIHYHPGCNFVNCTSAATHEAVDVAKKAQYVVLIMGLDQRMERESWDRTELGLPGQQETLITAVAKAAAEPVILVLVGGGPIDISFAKKNPKIGGILWIGYPGEAGAAALTQIIFGEHNAGGRLPVTWYPKEFTKVPMTDMNMRPNSTTGYPGRTYRFYKGPKVYEFGYGLSYTSYSYKIDSVNHDKLYFNNLKTDKARKHGSLLNVAVSDIGSEACKKANISVKVVVENKGKIAGKHPVLLFLRHSKVRDEVPTKQLIGFKSVHIDAGEKTKIKFVVNPCEHFTRANEYGISVIDEGKYYLVVEDKKYPVTVFI